MELKSQMKSQSSTNIRGISTKNKCLAGENYKFKTFKHQKSSKQKKHTKKCIYNDLFKIFFGLNICWGEVKTLQTFQKLRLSLLT